MSEVFMNDFSVAWQYNLLRKRLLHKERLSKPFYSNDEINSEYWLSLLREGKNVDEIMQEAEDDYYAALDFNSFYD